MIYLVLAADQSHFKAWLDKLPLTNINNVGLYTAEMAGVICVFQRVTDVERLISCPRDAVVIRLSGWEYSLIGGDLKEEVRMTQFVHSRFNTVLDIIA